MKAIGVDVAKHSLHICVHGIVSIVENKKKEIARFLLSPMLSRFVNSWEIAAGIGEALKKMSFGASFAPADDPLAVTLRPYYYLDRDLIAALFHQALTSAPPLRAERQVTSRASGEVRVDARVAAASGGGSRQVRLTEEFGPDENLFRQYQAVESELRDRRMIVWGFDGFDPENNQLAALREQASELKTRFGLELPTELIADWDRDRTGLRAIVARAHLCTRRGYVATSGHFTISDGGGDSLTARLRHPLSAYLPDGQEPVSVVLTLSKGNLIGEAECDFHDGAELSLTCTGRVVRWDEAGKALIVRPIAIF